MFCDRCGTKLAPEARICHSCGRVLGPATPVRRGLESHIRLLGILWLVHAGFSLLPGLIFLTVSGAVLRSPDIPPFVLNFVPLIGGFLMMGAALSTLVGVGLLMRQSWVRFVALVVAVLSVLNVPFGTALAIYTFWVLLPADHEEQFRALSGAA